MVKSEELHFKLNKRYRDELIEDGKLLLDFAKKLEKMEFVNKIDPYLLDEHFTAKKEGRKLFRQALDQRSNVLPEKLHMLIHGYIEGTKSFAYTHYLKLLLKTLTITPKQTVRLLTGRVTKLESLYEPENMIQARQSGFSGVKCAECGSWRNDRKYDTDSSRDRLFCYACKEWSEIKKEKLVMKEI